MDVVDGDQALNKRLSELEASNCWTCSNSPACAEAPIGVPFRAIHQGNIGICGGYGLLQIDGDGIVTEEVIARYIALHQQIEKVPVSSIAISRPTTNFVLRVR